MPHQIPRTGRILVVDDQSANVRVVSALLARHGYAVTAASSGKDALQAATGEIPDLLLLDMMMPGMDGFELLAALRELPGFRQVPTVFLTAAQDRDLLLRAFEAGAVDYVTKPFMPEELLARVNAHIGLKLTRDRLERVAHERQELVNLVAHDLKNPLSSVLFATEMLLLPDCKPERVSRYIEIIDGSSRDALGYIRTYLEGQERAAGAMATAAQPPSSWLRDTLDWLATRYELQLDAKGLRLRISPLERDACVAIDGLVLRQVAENLVTNALKYARDGGELELLARPGAPGFWQLVAQDRGPGIPTSRQRELFKPFQRLTEVDPADGMSSGLGLSLAKQIIINAGGQLWYEDREGGGARFVIELPEANCTTATTAG
ncbi:hybrid sensor histidine kinase/response regulator [Thermomonas carbonis]|uniref:histidine kinase n=1 Tax=Thermomonas carbonis TaxID=1463158 RepID=A0A7G9SSX9_9GAMM|nr:hybrid sensor histidine kinase/response regulator [Thermomonas carbonis]QNN70954.1 hybrid sensor histidine kinase/response regulator [Thermomonas carbonis]GHC03603.1 hybrid sensor histidine kinase/response regulator [Thermomonas carbonis]